VIRSNVVCANPYRALPSVDALIADARLAARHNNELIARVAREALEGARARIGAGDEPPDAETLVDEIERRLEQELAPPLRPLINATGVIIHTNLGRAPLADEAIDAMAAASRGYVNLEFDAATGARGSRHTLVEPLLRRLTGAEAAIAVNNNASALLLALSALAAGREVIMSRSAAASASRMSCGSPARSSSKLGRPTARVSMTTPRP
jgi:L-seryl-tRNA(Ser) seleniumtransferase